MRRCSSAGSLWANFRDLGERQARAVDDAGVVLLVEIHGVPAVKQAGDYAQIDLEPGGEGDGRRLADELGQLRLEGLVQVQGAVQKATARAASPIPVHGGDGRLLDLWMVGQPQVVVGPQHHQAAPAHHDLRLLGRLDGPEVTVGVGSESGLHASGDDLALVEQGRSRGGGNRRDFRVWHRVSSDVRGRGCHTLAKACGDSHRASTYQRHARRIPSCQRVVG